MENHKYMISSTPHIRNKESISNIMLDVLIALFPAAIMAAYIFGYRAIAIMILCVASSVFFEFLYQKLMKKPITITDLSAAVTGLLLAFNLPSSVPFWMPVVGSFFAIVLVKQLFGGLGHNFMNPALAARAFLLASYSTEMTDWSLGPNNLDGITSSTPLAILKEGIAPVSSDYVNAFIGNIGGCIGETCAVALLVGGVYLLIKKVISWRTPGFYIGTVLLFSFILNRSGLDSGYPLYELLTGGLLLGAIFMATDYSSSPVTPKGKIIMGIGCGVLTMVIRYYSGSYPEGVSYSILLMNLAVPLIDRYTRPKVFGVGKKKAV